MAEDKKGFILYADLIHTVEKMPLVKAGELFLHILKYVNDQNPITDDLIIELTFEPVKQQLKRDLKKYEDKRERNKDIAIAGWQKRKDANACERIETDAKNADKDNVIVNVTDTVNGKDNVTVKETVINNKRNFKEKISSHLFINSEFFDFNKFEKQFENSDYANADLKIYYESVKNWSASTGAKKIDWIATARNFIIGDLKTNKLKLKNGTTKTGNDLEADVKELLRQRYGN